MRPEDLTDDAKAILLLCGHFGSGSKDASGTAPLGTADYGRFSAFLNQRNLRPSSLLDTSILESLSQSQCPVEVPRLQALLSRGAAMGFAVEGWMNKGLWVICRSDATYPQRLKRKLREMAPPFLYGAGEISLLNAGGLAMVGSRSIGSGEEAFTSMAANRCACDGIQVVSGGAKGVDQTAMKEALAAGGMVVAALADGLLSKSLQKDYRQALHDRRLVMISTVHPEAGFNVGAAMGRNKLIYALADHALVVKADFKKGGTWSGADEELKRPNAGPVFVHPDFSGDKVVSALVKIGARIFPELQTGKPINQTLAECSAVSMENPSETPGLFSNKQTAAADTQAGVPREKANLPETKVPEITEPPTPAAPPHPITVFEAVWPFLAVKLQTPVTAADLGKDMDLRAAQVEDWLKHACIQGLARKLTKPVRYALGSEPKLL